MSQNRRTRTAQLRGEETAIKRRLERAVRPNVGGPVLGRANIAYELSARTKATRLDPRQLEQSEMQAVSESRTIQCAKKRATVSGSPLMSDQPWRTMFFRAFWMPA